jgi:hypothetical protein
VTTTNTINVLLRSTTINSSLKSIFIVPVIAVLLGAVPTTVYAQNDDQQQQQTCSDGSQPDENGNCPNDQQSQPSLVDQICNAYNNGEVALLAALLAPLHIATGGTTALILAAGEAYCASHG